MLENNISDSIKVNSGVRQGCILSPILFFMVIDWIQRTATSARNGRPWSADNLAEISKTQGQLQEKKQKSNLEFYMLKRPD